MRYSLDEAQALLADARAKVTEAATLVAQLRVISEQLTHGTGAGQTAEDVAVIESDIERVFAWFEQRGVQIKSLEPALLDFPARAIRDGEPIDVLLCWREDERTIGYYHPPEAGYRAREPVALLDQV